jgi:hypothetical protein
MNLTESIGQEDSGPLGRIGILLPTLSIGRQEDSSFRNIPEIRNFTKESS